MRSPTTAPRRTSLVDLAALAGIVLACLAVGYLGSLATAPNLEPWYANLVKPSWTPPDVAFPIVWTILYVAMAVAAWLVWRTSADPGSKRRALVGFGVQLALNGAWSWAFFAAQSPGSGLVVIAALLAAIAWTVRAFWRISRPAGILMLPYLAWVCFAAALNLAIFTMNS
ncbi:TspO/MBR family protein [Microbaculum marinum]|uniref:TspO/MBR family protein n=1 Tax=Microbaculum marinum TaxID=1764581 RepID=A0AAW9RMT1_9HYPH